MITPVVAAQDLIDDHVDVEIAECLNLAAPRSFFLFAGAGSGKTRSLVNALIHLRKQHGAQLRLRGQRIAVITYTNAACDEIIQRLEFDPVVYVSTIHSFAWTIVGGLTKDIRDWLRVKLVADVQELEALEAKGRAGTKASATRLAQIASKRRRLERLRSVTKFIYSPTGDNRGRDSLSHSEVIGLVSHFVQNKPTMQHIVVNSYPIILVDESQDTSRHLIDALFALQSAHRQEFSLGLLGDMMQRIYSDGKEGLGLSLPPDWATPKKRLNHRCPTRVVKLINKVREATDRQEQQPRSDAIEGHARIFILSAATVDKAGSERSIAAKMASLTGDAEWMSEHGYKCLILEHRMAARRLGFLDMFVPLYEVDEFKTGLLDGSLSITRFFSGYVLPLLQRQHDPFAVTKLIRSSSPLLEESKLKASSNPTALLLEVKAAISSLTGLWSNGASPSFGDVLRNVVSSGLFSIPEILSASDKGRLLVTTSDNTVDEEPEMTDRTTARTEAIEAFLESSFAQIEPYAAYVAGAASFDTHQGVKGREFPRVMVIMDDTEARGFAFKYEKLFAGGGDDATTASTRRLFYVTCSRAEKSLALVAYTTDPARVAQRVVDQRWFTEEEIERL